MAFLVRLVVPVTQFLEVLLQVRVEVRLDRLTQLRLVVPGPPITSLTGRLLWGVSPEPGAMPMSDIPEIAEQARKPREANRQEWIERLARFDSSGMTVLDFCRAEAIAAQSFYYVRAWPITPSAEEQTPTAR